MAIGIIFVYLTPGYAPNLMSYLLGSILTVSTAEIWLMLALALVIILFFTFFYRTILYLAFDEDFARTSGEQRHSNSPLWQSAHSEFITPDKLWPDFAKGDPEAAVAEFRRRERRYGAAAESL
jgi:hypothetical protein